MPSPTETRRSTSPVEDRVKSTARSLGFDDVGIASVGSLPDVGARLQAFIAAGRHGEMHWLADTAAPRSHPRALWPQAQCAVVVGHNYGPTSNPMDRLGEADRGVISAYAKGRDYHDVLKGRLKQLAGDIARWTEADVKVFVDTAPLMEKPLAEAAGIGWQGKHTNLVSRRFGSWLFLGVILTAARLHPDVAHDDQCGSCRKCLDVCPTDAFPAPYQLDARRCLAYLSIEHKGPIPHEFRRPLANRVFGCDDCLAVCPWNKFAETTREAKYVARVDTDDPPLAELLALDDQAFRKRFAGTPVKRTGRDRFLRTVAIAAGNSGDVTFADRLQKLATRDPSPLVRGAAVWALGELLDAETLFHLANTHRTRERDQNVLTEWTVALQSRQPPALSDAEAERT